MKDITKVFRKIITDLFPIEKRSEELLVAITYVLNLYDFYMSEHCPLTYKEVELTLNASVEIVAVFVFPPEKEKSISSWWKWRWHELMSKLHDETAFFSLTEKVTEKLKEHQWIDHLE